MSENTRQSVNASAGKTGQPVQSYQPVWMAHWMRTSSNAAAKRCNPSACGNEELDQVSKDDNLTNGSEASRLIKELGVIESKTFEVGNESRGKTIDYKGGFHSLGEGTSKNHLESIKTHSSTRDGSFLASKPCRETFVGPSTHIVPYYGEKYEFDKGKAAAGPNANLRMDSHSESDTSMNGRFRECTNTPLLLDAPSTSEHHLPLLGRDWFQKMQKCSGASLLPTQCVASEETESKKSHYNDLKTMRICTTVDSLEAIAGGFPRFSQTTHSLLITKKTDVNLGKENDILRTTRLITEMNGNTSSDLHRLSPFLGESNRGVKLQSLSSSSNSEGKRKIRDVEASKVSIKNESSAETDTMDMDIFKENLNSGANSAPSTKGFNIDSNLSPSSRGGIGHHWTKTKLPDINLELPPLPVIATSSEKTCPSSSRTQSLEMDTLLGHSEQYKPKSSPFLEDSSKEDPTKRWFKRLKLSTSNSSTQGTKSSNLGESPSHDIMRKLYRGVLENSITRKEDEDLTVEPTKKGNELLLSHSWIKRWLRNGSRVGTEKKPETVVVCEPQTSKLAIDDLQKKQFPSIAAMALMGKAVGSFQSCELQKNGTFTVWKAF